MWPFTPKTLYDRYSKLMKLIMSIDSHFEVAENEEDSVRLHLPNYKGNQPMDFHIYLMEPFLFISFVTEVEGEKISVVNSYPQNMDQQDMFNAAMASNMDRVHQVLENKHEKDDGTSTESKEADSKPFQTEVKAIGIKRSWPLLDFAKEHGKMQVGEFANKETGEVFKSCIFTKPDGTRTFVAFAAKMGELTPKQIAAMKNELQVVQLESGNYSLCKIGPDSWENAELEEGNNESGIQRSESDDSINNEYVSINDAAIAANSDSVCGNKDKLTEEKMDAMFSELEKERAPYDVAISWMFRGFIKGYKKVYKGCCYCVFTGGGENALIFERENSEKTIVYNLSGLSVDKINESKNSLSIDLRKSGEYFLCDHGLFDIIESDSSLVSVEECDSLLSSNISETDNLDNTADYKFENTWSITEFMDLHGKMCVEQRINTVTGEEFSSLLFVDEIGREIHALVFDNMSNVTLNDILKNISVYRIGAAPSQYYTPSYYYLYNKSFDFWLPGMLSTDNKDKNTNPEATPGVERDRWADGNGIPYIIDYVPSSSDSADGDIKGIFKSKYDNICPESEGKLDKDADTCIDEYGVEYSLDKKILKKVPKETTDYSILDGTEIIGDASFSNCEDLVSVSIPDSVKEIGHYAFAGCKKIFTFIIPRGVKAIGDGAFMNCETLKSLRLSEGLASISDDAFNGCNNLNTIFVPVEEKVRFEIMLSIFDVNITEYNTDNVNSLDELLSGLLDESGVWYSRDGKIVFTHTKKLTSYTIKPGTQIINANAFCPIEGVDDDHVSLIEINLPDSITTIWDSAFAFNEGLKEISLPSSIKTIGKDVFKGCKALSKIRIPHGTLDKFEKLLPEWKDILVEKYKIVSDTLSGFVLPDGSIYNGGCLRNPFSSVVLNGIGSLTYPNGDNYKGNFKNGRPYGWGLYLFQNGHKYKGYFDEQPKGIGYLNEDYDMTVGNFYEGRLNGWAICYRNRIFKFGYWQNGKLICDETDKTLWVRAEISELRMQYQGNLIQISQGHEFIRFGIPEREIIKAVDMPNAPKWPAMGFEFFKDGTVKVGEIKNNSSGNYILCKNDGTMLIGYWKDDVKEADKTLSDFQRPIDSYEVDGLDVFK